MTELLGPSRKADAVGGAGATARDPFTYRSYGHGAAVPSAELARLHRTLLPTSPIHDLGSRFVEGFYFGVLPEEELLFGQVAYEGVEPVGFVAVTDDANGFLGTALRRRWRTLAGLTLRHPPAPRRAWNALRLVRERESASAGSRVSEILSMGVLPPAEGQRPSRERRRIARTFVEWAVEQLPDQPIQALVDESNLAARLMYGELGWDAVGRVEVGWPVPQLVYQAPPAADQP